MGHGLITARIGSTKDARSECEKNDLRASREYRSTHRVSVFEQNSIKCSKSSELRDAKSAYDDIRSERPEDKQSDEYNEWYQDYQMAKEEYEAEKLDINEFWDEALASLEEQTAEDEADYERDKTSREALMEAYAAEIESLEEKQPESAEEQYSLGLS